MRNRILGRRYRKRKEVIVAPLPVAALFDHFNAPDDTALLDRIPPVRPNSEDWSVPTGAFTIQNNRLQATFSTGVSLCIATFDSGLTDVEITQTVTFPSTGSSRSGGFVFRYSDNNNRFSAIISFDQGDMRIVQRASGTDTTLASFVFTPESGVDYDMTLTIQGDLITFTVANVQTIQATSSVGNTRTVQGIRGNNGHTGLAPIFFENFLLKNSPATADVVLTISDIPLTTSHFLPGHTEIHNPPTWSEPGWNNAKVSISQCSGVYAKQMSHFGMKDTWELGDPNNHIPGDEPDTALPNNLTGGSQSVQGAVNKMNEVTALDPSILLLWVFYGYPFWMKGTYNSSGITTPLPYRNAQGELNTFSAAGRIMTQYQPHAKILTREVAKITLAAGVRWYVWWNEFKGHENDHTLVNQRWAADYFSGTPGLHADMGYTWGYKNIMIDGVYEAADFLGINRSEIKFGGAYPVLRNQENTSNADAVNPVDYPMLHNRIWGTAIKMGWNAQKKFHDEVAANELPYHGYVVDVSIKKKVGGDTAPDEWAQREYNTDLMAAINAEKVRAGLPADFPVIGAEVYLGTGLTATEIATTPPGFVTALKSDSYRRLMLGGMHHPLQWGTHAVGLDESPTHDPWTLTSTVTNGGGQLLPWGVAQKGMKDHFGPGTVIYEHASTAPSLVEATPSAEKVWLINKTDTPKTVQIAPGNIVTLNGHEVAFPDR